MLSDFRPKLVVRMATALKLLIRSFVHVDSSHASGREYYCGVVIEASCHGESLSIVDA